MADFVAGCFSGFLRGYPEAGRLFKSYVAPILRTGRNGNIVAYGVRDVPRHDVFRSELREKLEPKVYEIVEARLRSLFGSWNAIRFSIICSTPCIDTERPRRDSSRHLGFEPDTWQILAEALREHGRTHEIVRAYETGFGTRSIVEGELNTPDGRRPRVRSVWQFDEGTIAPRLITAYPLEDS